MTPKLLPVLDAVAIQWLLGTACYDAASFAGQAGLVLSGRAPARPSAACCRTNQGMKSCTAGAGSEC